MLMDRCKGDLFAWLPGRKCSEAFRPSLRCFGTGQGAVVADFDPGREYALAGVKRFPVSDGLPMC